MALFHLMAEPLGLSIVHPPSAAIAPMDLNITRVRDYAGGPVALISDGSSQPGRVGWGAVIADPWGVLAEAHGGVCCDVAYSWAAEWLAKFAALHLAGKVGIPSNALMWSVADNISAHITPDGARPSLAPWIDAIRLAYAARTASTPLKEGYIPAPSDARF